VVRLHTGGAAPAESITLTFTVADWNTAQTVTVTGQDDDIDSRWDRGTSVEFGASGGGYDGVTGRVGVDIIDDDTAGFALSKSALSVAEANGIDDFTVALTSEPSFDVTVTLASSDATMVQLHAGTATPAGSVTLTFTTADWDTVQTVTVTGQDDDIDNAGDSRLATIELSASGGGGSSWFGVSYDGITGSFPITVTDDDEASTTPTSITLTVDTDSATAGN